ncbi:MAG: sodium-dependent transporter [Candidatus Ornithospirochaeta sp.]|nr:sodium-dependent transporter [Candidatus Ornithospirochaeta sp.]
MQNRERLSSRLGFILLSAGCAIGLGNVWRFPYVTGKHGGAAFVLIYLFFLLLIGLPVMTMEFAIGRGGKKNIVGALRALEKPGTNWHIYGPIAIAGNYILLMFYLAISGWLLYYFFSFAAGSVASDTSFYFSNLLASPAKQVFWMALSLSITAIVVSAGLKNGVEKITKTMMMILFVLMIGLAIHACSLEGAKEGIVFYIKPDFSNLSENLSETIFVAMGQAFFTLSLGIGSMEIFGSYIGNERTLAGESARIILLDTAIALLSGFIIFPACSAYSVEPGAGPALLFLSLPKIFTQMQAGRFWGTVFFLAMFFAATSTLIAVFENISSYWIDQRGMERRKAALLNAVLLFFLSLPCILGFNVLSSFQPLGPGSGVLDLEDFIVSNLILPLGSMVFVIFCTCKKGWGWDAFTAEADKGKGMKFPAFLRFYSKYVLPFIILIVSIKGIWDVIGKVIA